MKFVLHSMWRATAPYRVRIALALKDLAFDYAPLDLAGGEQRSDSYRRLNRQGLVPALEADGRVLTQSLAIIEWLEDTHPQPPLLPSGAFERAIVRTMASIIACDVHPLNNLRVLQALGGLGVPMGSPAQQSWGSRWICEGFQALEPMVAQYGRGFAFGASPGLADCLIVPQIWSSSRFSVDLSPFPALGALYARAQEHPAFIAAHPDQTPDAPRVNAP
ncbi:MAG: maleylacetoacetate isomerase [Caulobacteraceae bacterium]